MATSRRRNTNQHYKTSLPPNTLQTLLQKKHDKGKYLIDVISGDVTICHS